MPLRACPSRGWRQTTRTGERVRGEGGKAARRKNSAKLSLGPASHPPWQEPHLPRQKKKQKMMLMKMCVLIED